MTLHVGLYDSAAGHLTRLMRLLGRRDRVLCLEDDLSFGPIAEGTTFDARARWFAAEVAGYMDRGDEPRAARLICPVLRRRPMRAPPPRSERAYP